ncbi:hypothetical protein [Bacillus weihaiensis]|uniref:hypothetical protein n=1 Tax=Bacillus weihaiensis TaxID=1547283 RepID=UPI00235717A0|nr:hypothetical protein [Bacillus weihaiensis]
MENDVFTEEEAINITIKHGYKGNEFNTSTWKQRGCLRPDRTFDGLISKLNTIYNFVDVEGKGKKRQYILKDKKDKVTERIKNYKGSVATIEDEIMKEYIFNSLSTKSDFTQAYRGWANTLKFPDVSKLSVEEMIAEIKRLHRGFPRMYNPNEVVSRFIQTINTRNKDVIEKSFKRLVQEGRIKLTEIYNVKNLDGQYDEVNELEYKELQLFQKEILDANDTTLGAYSQARTSIFKSKKMKEVIHNVSKQLAEEFNIEYFFTSYNVRVLNPEIRREVSIEEFNNAYINRLIKLTSKRHTRKENNYDKSLQFWKRFYLLNTLALLNYMGAEVKERFEDERVFQIERTDDFDKDTMIHNLNADMRKEEIRYSFGSVEVNEESLPF